MFNILLLLGSFDESGDNLSDLFTFDVFPWYCYNFIFEKLGKLFIFIDQV